jgi:hypothetical protein
MSRPDTPPPALLPVVRYYAPWLAGAAVVGAVAFGYLDLSARVSTLEARVGIAGPAPQTGPAEGVTDRDGGAAPAVVTRGPAPAWTCRGEIGPDVVRASIGLHGPDVLRCFEQRVAQEPGLRGTLLVRARVTASGAVDSVHVAGIADPPLVSCVGSAAVRWTFAPPVGGDCAVIEAPFALGASP